MGNVEQGSIKLLSKIKYTWILGYQFRLLIKSLDRNWQILSSMVSEVDEVNYNVGWGALF